MCLLPVIPSQTQNGNYHDADVSNATIRLSHNLHQKDPIPQSNNMQRFPVRPFHLKAQNNMQVLDDCAVAAFINKPIQ